jgi:hypothetical protein
MIQLFKPGYGPDDFQQRIDLFCFTDVRLSVTPEQSMQLKEQLLRLSDLFAGIVDNYLDTGNPKRYTFIAIKAARLAKRFLFISKALSEKGIDQEALLLFKRELATAVYADCVTLKDKNMYRAMNSFLYKKPVNAYE